MLKKLLVLCSMLIAVLFTGCGEKKEPQTPLKEKKDVLVYAQLSEGKTLDPQDSTEQYSQVVTTQIYDRLVEIDEMTGKLVPGLADSWERVDDLTLIMHLNKTAKFHNGDPLKASDVKFTLERAKSKPKVAHLFKAIKDVEILDDNTIKIVTEEPFAPLLNHLSHKTAAIISEKYFKENGDNYFMKPIGTGSYKFKNWVVGESITLEANEEYFKGKPSIKTIIIKGIPEENSRVIGLETGEIDIAEGIATIGRKAVEDSKDLTLMESPSTSVTYLGFSLKNPILQDREVRRAISMGINREEIIKGLMFGDVKIANGFLAPAVFGYSKDSKVLSYNKEEAKRIIESKGLKGAKLSLVTSNNQLRAQIAEIMQAQLKEIGLDVTLQTLEWGAFLKSTGNGELDMFMMGWGPSTYDGDYGLYPNFHSSQFGNNGNRTFYSNEKIDALLDSAKKEMDLEKRRGMYIEVINIVNEDAPVLPINYSNTIIGVTNKLEGVQPISYPMFYKYNFKK